MRTVPALMSAHCLSGSSIEKLALIIPSRQRGGIERVVALFIALNQGNGAKNGAGSRIISAGKFVIFPALRVSVKRVFFLLWQLLTCAVIPLPARLRR